MEFVIGFILASILIGIFSFIDYVTKTQKRNNYLLVLEDKIEDGTASKFECVTYIRIIALDEDLRLWKIKKALDLYHRQDDGL